MLAMDPSSANTNGAAAAATIMPASPFRPPKIPLRSLPPAKGASPLSGTPLTLRGGLVAGGPRTFTPLNSNSNLNGGFHADPNAPNGAAAAAGGGNGNGSKMMRTMAPPPPPPPKTLTPLNMPSVPASKALPIINKQTGEAIVKPTGPAAAVGAGSSSHPQPPAAIESLDGDSGLMPVGHGSRYVGGANNSTLTPTQKPAAASATNGSGPAPPAALGLTPLGCGAEDDLEPVNSGIAGTGSSKKRLTDVVICAESVESGIYSTSEMMSLREESEFCPESFLNLVLSDILPRLPPSAPIPKRLRLLKDAPDHLLTQERGGFGSAAGSHNVLNSAAALRLRQVKETHQKVMSVLSRITPEKFDALKEELMNLPLRQTDEKQLKQVVEVFFEKAVQEQMYSQLYAALVAQMCLISETERALPKDERDKLFASRMRRELLNKCQEEFNKPLSASSDDRARMTPEELESARSRFKKRLCGNIKFVCELYHRSLVTDRVIDNILQILTNGNTDEDYVAEAISTTIMSAGSSFSRTKPEEFERHMAMVARLRTSHPSKRIQFLMMDVEDARKKGFDTNKNKSKVMTHEELDRVQLNEARKLEEDMDRKIRDQKKAQKRDKKVVPSVPSSPVTPSREAKLIRGNKSKHGGGSDTATSTPGQESNSSLLRPHTPVSPSAQSGEMLPPPSPGLESQKFPTPGGLYSHNMSESTASLTDAGAVNPLTKEQAASKAKDMMQKLSVGGGSPGESTQSFKELNPLHRVQVLTGWLRLAVTSTKLWTEREQLPSLFADFLRKEKDDSDVSSVFTSAEMSKILQDWAIIDIDNQQYDNCPRMFGNWAQVIEYASKWWESSASARDELDVDPATVVHPGTVNLFLQEYRRQAETNTVVESFSKDVLSSLDTATENNLLKVVSLVSTSGQQPNGDFGVLNPIVMPLLQRFRLSAHLSYTEGKQGDELCKKLLENSKLKEDLELNLFHIFSNSKINAIPSEADALFTRRSKSLSPLHNLLKATSAALAVLIPYHGCGMAGDQHQAEILSHGNNIPEERAVAVATTLKTIYSKTIRNLSSGDPKIPLPIAEHLAGVAILAEALQHAALAVSSATERSNPTSPNTQGAPKTPSNSVAPSPLSPGALLPDMTFQLEFEQKMTSGLTSKLAALFVGSDITGFISGSALDAVRVAVGGVRSDVWAVSPPPSLRPINGNGQVIFSNASMEELGGSSHLLGSPAKTGNSSSSLGSLCGGGAGGSPLHSRALTTSMLNALVASY